MNRHQPRNYWMAIVTPDHFRATREHGLTVLGMARSQKKRVQRMEVGDRLLYYVSIERAFVAAATVKSTYFEDHTVIWSSSDPEETYPWRVRTHPDVVLQEEEFIDARQVAPRLEYVRKWTPESWPLAFQGPLHLIPKRDLLLLEDEMRKLVDRRRRVPHHAAS